jgi:NAD(P)H-hydrate epimerase
LQEAKKPLVVDADALTLLDKSLLNELCVITPHPGEMAKLTGLSVKEVLEDIIKCARDFAREYGAITLLKDARTIIASPCGKTYVNTSGSPALAKAGSGDVLSGVLAAFLAQGMDTLEAAVLAANIHGKAGQAAAEDLSVYGVRATDVIEYISKVMR